MDDIDITNAMMAREEARRSKAIKDRQEAMARRPVAIYCADCGAHIPRLRREALPGVELCVDCAAAVERGGFW